jgi:hypothetical protein
MSAADLKADALPPAGQIPFRRDTYQSLREEPETADELIESELSHTRVGQAVHDGLQEAAQRIGNVRDAGSTDREAKGPA